MHKFLRLIPKGAAGRRHKGAQRWPWRVVGFVLGLALLLLSFREADTGAVWRVLLGVNWAWVLAALGAALCGLLLRAWRWRVLLESCGVRSSWRVRLGAILFGQATNALLPGRVGDFVRGWTLSRLVQGDLPATLTTILAEDVFDLALLLAFSLALVAGMDTIPIISQALPGLTLGTLVAFGMLGVVVHRRSHLTIWLTRISQRWPYSIRVADWLLRAMSALHGLRRLRVFARVALISVFVWLAMAGTNLVLFPAFGLPASPAAAGLVLVLAFVGAAPSLMPGNLGPFYFFVSAALRLLDVGAELALGYAIVLHLLVTAPAALGGGLFLLARTDLIAVWRSR